MNNLEKLLKFLLSDKDIVELANKNVLPKDTVKDFCMDVFARIIPNDFTKHDSSHIEEKDFRAIVANFNLLLKEENLKPLMISGVKKYGFTSSQASALVGGILPLLHGKIQILTKPANATPAPKAEKTMSEEVKKTEVVETVKEETLEAEEVNEIFDAVSKRAEEDVETIETVTKKKSFTMPKFKKPEKKEKVAKPVKVQEGDIVEDESLSTVEKACMYTVIACLALLIIFCAYLAIKI